MIVDMGLPDRRGDALIREVRVLYPSLPIVLATGLGEADLRKIFKDEERMAFVIKPYTRDNLLNGLRDVGVRISAAR